MHLIMKTIDKVSILCILALAVSCGQKNEEPAPVKPEVQPETRTLTFVLPSVEVEEGEEAPSALKSAWQAGDQIVVHGEYAKNQVVVTLSAGDISADGKSATLTVEGLYPYQREDCASTLYASYPASAVDNLKHCFFYSKFSTTNAELMAASNSGDTFRFQRITGILSMQAEGEFDSYLLTTAKKEALGYDYLQVKLTDVEQNYFQYYGGPQVEVTGAVSGSDIMVYLPDGTTLSSGFNLKLFKDGECLKTFKYTEPVKIARGGVAELGDVTAELKDYVNPFSPDVKDLDVAGNANCYILTEPGTYKFKAVCGNSATQYLSGVEGGAVLWETWNTADSLAVVGTIVESVSFAEDYMLLNTAETLHSGNALIAAVDADGNVLWSWHLWVPATTITDVDASLGSAAMDRNLGALVATEEVTSGKPDALSFGMFYQWGRKDPFPGQLSNDANGPFKLAGLYQMKKITTPITTEESIAKPNVYACNKNGNEGYNWNVASIPGAWGESGDKTIYDPCPAGYRVPKGNWSSSDPWVYKMANGWFKIGTVVFPYCGYMDDNGGSYSKMGERSVIWNAKSTSIALGDIICNGSAAYIKSEKFDSSSARAARGSSVRCVKE